MNDFLSVRQTADFLGLPETTIRWWIRKRQPGLKPIRLGGKILFKRSELEQWVEESKTIY